MKEHHLNWASGGVEGVGVGGGLTLRHLSHGVLPSRRFRLSEEQAPLKAGPGGLI